MIHTERLGFTLPLIDPRPPYPGDLDLEARVKMAALTQAHEADPRGFQRGVLMYGAAGEMPQWESSLPVVRKLVQFVIKTWRGCNLACDYCYEYEGEDQSWRDMPPQMSEETLLLAGRRIGAYAFASKLPRVELIFHGGEPLLAGRDYYARVAPMLREIIGELAPSTAVDLGMQTNGVALTRGTVAMLRDRRIKTSVSVDGGQAAHDRHRTFSQGQGTYRLVERGINRLRLPENRDIYGGLLCVIDIDNDALDVYDALRAFDPPQLDLMLPYATWDNPPKGYEKGPRSRSDPARYAEWLIPIFNQWWDELNAGGPLPPDVRFFKSILNMIAGGWSTTEAIGPDTGGEVVIRTDGSYELVDALKWGVDGAVATGMNLIDNDIAEVAEYMRAGGHLGKKALALVCQTCPFNARDICGGGHIANRYSEEKGFDNASVYCYDLADIIDHIREAFYRKIQQRQAVLEERLQRARWAQNNRHLQGLPVPPK